jgi:hypothetical protein
LRPLPRPISSPLKWVAPLNDQKPIWRSTGLKSMVDDVSCECEISVALVAALTFGLSHTSGGTILADIAVAAVSLLVGAIAVRSMIAISRHTFLPRPERATQLRAEVEKIAVGEAMSG